MPRGLLFTLGEQATMQQQFDKYKEAVKKRWNEVYKRADWVQVCPGLSVFMKGACGFYELYCTDTSYDVFPVLGKDYYGNEGTYHLDRRLALESPNYLLNTVHVALDEWLYQMSDRFFVGGGIPIKALPVQIACSYPIHAWIYDTNTGLFVHRGFVHRGLVSANGLHYAFALQCKGYLLDNQFCGEYI